MSRNGVLCIEGDWEDGLARNLSLIPVLQLVKSQTNMPFIHRTASTRDEFRRVIEEWTKAKYSKYPILYLGFHGTPGALQIGKENIPICDLHEFAGKGKNRIIHFGACETLKAPRRELNQFMKSTRFTAICGFRMEVDWLHSSALEIIVLEELTRRKISIPSVTLAHKNIMRRCGPLARELGFHIWSRGNLYTR